MDAEIDPTERRLLGVLIEKQLSTPDAYPLSVRDVHVGANQKSCRDPVANYAEWQVEGALAALFDRKWATYVDGGRVRKWKHRVDERLGLTATRLAVLAELLLRGPQAPAELRRNAQRMANLPTEADVMAALEDLASKTPPLVRRLSKRPREHDCRWTQLLAPDDGVAAPTAPPTPTPIPSSPLAAPTDAPTTPSPRPAAAAAFDATSVLARLDALEREVADLRARMTP